MDKYKDKNKSYISETGSVEQEDETDTRAVEKCEVRIVEIYIFWNLNNFYFEI